MTDIDEALMIEFLKNKNEIEKLTERNKEIEQLAGLRTYKPEFVSDGPKTLDAGRAVVKLSPNNRWDDAKALAYAVEHYPLNQETGENADLYDIKVKSTVAKKRWTAEEYAAAQKNFAPKVTVELK